MLFVPLTFIIAAVLLSGLLLLFVVVLSEEKKNKEKTPSQFWNLRWELRPMHDVVVSFIIVSC